VHHRAVRFVIAFAMTLCVCCVHPRASHWLIPAAAAAEKVEQGPRSKIRVRCGTLSDMHGAQVLGRGAGGSARAESERCLPAPSLPAKAAHSAPVAAVPPPPITPEKPAPAPKVAEARRARTPAPTPVPVAPQSIRVGAEWSGHRANHERRFTPTNATRLSTAIATGGVLWFLQSSFWASLLLLGLPIWRHVDLLAIVARTPDDEAGERQTPFNPSEDEPVSRVLDDGRNPHLQRVPS
jgi:hypothetical protein